MDISNKSNLLSDDLANIYVGQKTILFYSKVFADFFKTTFLCVIVLDVSMIHKLLAIIAITSLLTLSVMSMGTSLNESAFAKKCTTVDYEYASQEVCSNQGKTPSVESEICYDDFGCYSDSNPTTHKNAAQYAVDNQQYCKQVLQKQGIDCSTSNGR
ncbi:hypothetical protein [Candidatus Nitrosocosmicus sp. R]